MGLIKLQLFLVVFPAGILFTMMPVCFFWLFGRKKDVAQRMLLNSFVGAVAGYITWFIYYLVTDYDGDSSLYGLSFLGSMSIGGYSMILTYFYCKIKDKAK